MKRTVTVLQDDIDRGMPGHISLCAVARAVRRDLADLGDHAVVSGIYLRVRGAEHRLWGALPFAVQQCVSDFDSGLPVQPFKFEVELAGEDLPLTLEDGRTYRP